MQQVEHSVDKRKELLVKHANGQIHAEVLPKEHHIPKKSRFWSISLMDKIVDFIKRMRLKADFHLNPAVSKEE